MKDFAPNCPLYVQILKPENKFHVKFAGVFGALWHHGHADCKGVKGGGEVKYSSHELKEVHPGESMPTRSLHQRMESYQGGSLGR